MLALPQSPEWRPDELIGSVLTEVVDANSLGSKHVLLKWLGLTRAQRNSQFMDINVLTSTWIELADKLGIDLKVLVETLSTKPYWACFHTRRRMSMAKIANADLAQLSVPESVLIEHSRTRSELQLCPDCLREDSLPVGPSYVHRSHQLPGTLVCHKHGKALFHRCPACDRILAPHLDLIRISDQCECGCDLTEGEAVRKDTAIYQLAKFEHQCLHSTHAPRPAREVILFIGQTCRERGVSMQTLAVEMFGENLNRWRVDGTGGIADPRLRLQFDGMPALCACLVALGFDYASAQAALDQNSAPIKPARHNNTLFRPQDASEARAELIALKRSGEVTGWHSLRIRSRFVFWFLLLTDRSCLVEHFGPPHWRLVTQPPSIEQDRQTIVNTTSLHQSMQATARAHCRDKVWLDQFESRRRVAPRRARDDKREGMIRSARKKANEAPGRPVKFTVRHAASAAGLSLVGVADLDRRLSLNDGHLWESATQCRCRLLLWALQERVARGARLSPNLLIGEAGGMEKKFMQRFYAASIIYLFGPDAASDLSA